MNRNHFASLRGARTLTALLFLALFGWAQAAAAADPCLIFVHGKRDGAAGPDWQAGRDYWRDGSNDFIQTATQNFALPYYVIGYHGNKAYWDPEAAGLVATEIVNATLGLPDVGGSNTCPSLASGGSFWVVAHSMGGNIMDFILGNATPSDPNYNTNGPFDSVAAALELVVSVSGSHRGSELADAACGESSFFCNIGGFFIQGCTTGNFWLRSDESVQVRGLAGSPAKNIYLTGGYEAIPVASLCLSGEDDGVVQHASQYACNGSATASYDNDDVCDESAKQELAGFRNLDSGAENHDDTRNDADRDTRRTIPDGAWYCGATPCAPDVEVQSSMSSAQLVSRLVDDGVDLNKPTPACGLGPELALLLPLFAAARRRVLRA